jgi:aminopeptidase N
LNSRSHPLLHVSSLSALLLLTAFSLPLHAQPGRGQGNPFKAPQATIHTPHIRTYHVRHLKLEFTIDAAAHAARGVVTHYLTPLQDGLAVVSFDMGSNLKVENCKVNDVDTAFKHEGELLTISPAQPLSMAKETTVEIRYAMESAKGRGGGANGAGGFTWIDPNPSNPDRTAGFWTQGETQTNHKWVPCYDYPNDKCTSETHTTVPDNWTVIGNGAELPATSDAQNHTKTYHWVMKQPHSTYLLSLAGGEMDVQKDQWAGVPLYYAVPKGMGKLIPTSFGHTPDMLAFFSRRFGYKYPWSKYAQVCAFDFPGGMENVSATTLGTPPGVMIDARSNRRGTDSLISHELGHQWFGDLVTCSDWGDVWLNEGFATFCEMLYTEHLDGKDAYEQDRMGALGGFLAESRRYKRSLSTNLYTVGDAMFGSGHTYSRGGLTLHMLRRELGDNVFFGGLSRYLKANAYKPVATSDLIKSLSETAGHDLAPWFDQWVFKPGHPIVDWSWSYDDAGKYTVLHLKQTQDTSEGTPIYSTPLHVAILLPVGSHGKVPVLETVVTLDKAEQEIRIPGSIKPESVIIDPRHDLLMETKGPGPSDAELPAQLRFAPSYQERLRAARRLGAGEKGRDDATVKMLADALTTESSDIAAAGILNVLADTKKESLRSVFRAQTASRQPLRRAAALAALGVLPAAPEDVTLLRQVAMSDTESYTLVENALRGLSHMDAAANLDVFQHQVDAQSTRDRLANTVVSLLADAKLDAGVPVLLKAAAPGRNAFLRRSAIRAIGTLAPQNPDVHTALIAASKSEGQTYVQTAAIDALKDRKDMAALDTLRDLAANAKDSSVRSSAQDAVTELSSK